MAKKTKIEAPAAPAVNNPATPAAGRIVAKKVFGKEPNGADLFVRVLGPDGKGKLPLKADGTPAKNAPQEQIICNLLEASGPKGLSRKDLCDKLPAAGLVTKQPVGRIVSYYQKPLVTKGCITITKAAPAPAPAAPVAAPVNPVGV